MSRKRSRKNQGKKVDSSAIPPNLRDHIERHRDLRNSMRRRLILSYDGHLRDIDEETDSDLEQKHRCYQAAQREYVKVLHLMEILYRSHEDRTQGFRFQELSSVRKKIPYLQEDAFWVIIKMAILDQYLSINQEGQFRWIKKSTDVDPKTEEDSDEDIMAFFSSRMRKSSQKNATKPTIRIQSITREDDEEYRYRSRHFHRGSRGRISQCEECLDLEEFLFKVEEWLQSLNFGAPIPPRHPVLGRVSELTREIDIPPKPLLAEVLWALIFDSKSVFAQYSRNTEIKTRFLRQIQEFQLGDPSRNLTQNTKTQAIQTQPARSE